MIEGWVICIQEGTVVFIYTIDLLLLYNSLCFVMFNKLTEIRQIASSKFYELTLFLVLCNKHVLQVWFDWFCRILMM